MRGNEFIFTSILSSFQGSGMVDQQYSQVHSDIIKTGFESVVSVSNTLVGMYARCGRTEAAQQVFEMMPSKGSMAWSAMISGNVVSGNYWEAVQIFQQGLCMRIQPNKFIYGSVLKALKNLKAFKEGLQVHGQCFITGLQHDKVIVSCLIDFYQHCRKIDNAQIIFTRASEKDTVLWTTMIAGYVLNNHWEGAMTLFCQMLHSTEKPSEFTFTSLFDGCANIAALEAGKQLHVHAIKKRFDQKTYVGSALVDMYAKCGALTESCTLFQMLPERSIVSWTAMIMGYAWHGNGRDALLLFEEMLKKGFKPNDVTLLAVLSACSCSGLVDEAYCYFSSMKSEFSITPTQSHYVCMVDIHGRSGRVAEAETFIASMPCEPSSPVWQALLGACSIHGNAEIGERAANRLFELNQDNLMTYVQLSHLYAKARRWADAAKLRDVVRLRGLKKVPGISWIEIRSSVHIFYVNDLSLAEL